MNKTPIKITHVIIALTLIIVGVVGQLLRIVLTGCLLRFLVVQVC